MTPPGWLLALAVGSALLLAVACGSPFPHPSSATVSALRPTDPTVHVEDLEHGRDLYLAKCSSCHALYEPVAFAPEAWPEKVSRMQREKRVHLADAELADITRYLRATSAVTRR